MEQPGKITIPWWMWFFFVGGLPFWILKAALREFVAVAVAIMEVERGSHAD